MLKRVSMSINLMMFFWLSTPKYATYNFKHGKGNFFKCMNRIELGMSSVSMKAKVVSMNPNPAIQTASAASKGNITTCRPVSAFLHNLQYKALPLVTVIVGKKTGGSEVTVFTTTKFAKEEPKTTFELPNERALIKAITTHDGPKWAKYIKGVIAKYIGDIPPGFNAVVHTSVPIGGGLSSSASLEVATYLFLDQLVGAKVLSTPLTKKALACQKAEHDYAEMPCGIMDQFISFMGKKDHALLIDCRNLTSSLIPMNDDNVVILITNSNIKHELTGSEYSTRRQQCEEAAQLLKKISLRDASMNDIKYLQSINTRPEIIARARHVITEIQRTVEAAEMLKQTDFITFGKLMTESHYSLRDDYQVSCQELDSLVNLALEVEGVLGSRMTGGGFGGCTVTLVYSHSANNLIEHIKSKYKGNATFYLCKPSSGASVIS